MRELSEQALAARMIRKELKTSFPKTKFSVTSSSFAGGNAVDIGWDDGPSTENVDKIVKKYQYGHFNGMDDTYNYSNSKEDLPQVRFVMTARHISDLVRDSLLELANIKLEDYNKYNSDYQEFNSSVIWQMFVKRVF